MIYVCEKVRRTCISFVESESCRKYVTIDRNLPLHCLASEIVRQQRERSIQWDDEAWHYQPPMHWPKSIREKRMAHYILALDSINFCFWPTPGYEYDDLATTLTSIANADHDTQEEIIQRGDEEVSPQFTFMARMLAEMTLDKMTALFQKHHSKGLLPPDLEKRCELWNEVGRVLAANFNGSALSLIQSAGGSAPRLVELLVEYIPGFRDDISSTSGNDETCHYFYKRAQICVGDWNASLVLQLKELENLTTFADYRVPQLLRHRGVLQYTQQLADIVDSQQEIVAGSPEEIAIRATTVAAVEYLVEELRKENTTNESIVTWTAVQADWYLWQVGEKLEKEHNVMKPHHRVRTIYY